MAFNGLFWFFGVINSGHWSFLRFNLDYSYFEDQKEQTKRITLLLDNRNSGAGEWEKSFKALEERLANQEKAEKEFERQNKRLKKALQEERKKGFFQKLFG